MVLQDPGSTYAVLPSSIRSRRIQPGKRTILVSCLLSFMLLMSQLLRALQLDHPPKLTNVQVLQSLSNLNEEVEAVPCIKTHIGIENSKIPPNQSCQHLLPSRGLCSLIQNLFFSKKPPGCEHQSPVTFCKREKNEIVCASPSVCANLQHYIGIFNEESATVKWQLVSTDALQKEVTNYSLKTDSLGFVFIKCSSSEMVEDLGQPQYDEAFMDQIQTEYSQLFLFPPVIERSDNKNDGNININLLMIDSLSRTHFYRSLPKTVKLLEELSKASSTEVLDFQLFQAVKQRTYESLQALFSGFVNTSEVPFGTYDIPKAPLPIAKLYGKFKKKGYKTLWIEDLCWNWEWGLIKDLKVMNDSLDDTSLWHNLKLALKAASIDSIDVSVASCDILAANGKKDPFRGLPVVCYNGRHQHEYILEYLQLYHEAVQESSEPFITYTSTSVSHDESGIRVQSLDEPLANYLKFAGKLENTLTIVFADHGNTYGKFIESSPDAHAETFNPSLFMIIPQSVQNHLGDLRMRILKENEKRLVTLVDVHHMLLEMIQEKTDLKDKDFLQHYVVPGGLLSSIPVGRSCNDLPLLQPNLCICRDYELIMEPSSVHMALADFGLGVLNNMVLAQHRKDGNSGFGNCKPMKALELRKVREIHIAADLIRYKLDVLVEGAEIENKTNKNIFFLTLEAGRIKPSLRLVSYERLSQYGMFGACQDKSVELKLCVCDTDRPVYKGNLINSLLFGNLLPGLSFLTKNRETSDKKLIEFLFTSSLGTKPEIDFFYPSDDPCLYTVIHKYKAGIVLQALNFCTRLHKLEIYVNAVNMYISANRHSSFLLYPRDIKVLIGGVSANPKVEWHWDHSIKIY